MIAERIRILREAHQMTQTELAKKLGVTRSGVNAWEMGVSVPSTQYVVELALLFDVSADYLLGIEASSTINVSGLTDEQVSAVLAVIRCFKNGEALTCKTL